MSQNSIQKQLVRGLLITVTVAFGIAALAIFEFVRISLISDFDDRLEETIAMLVDGTKMTPEGEIESEFHEQELDSFSKGEDSYYELTNGGRKLVIGSESLLGDQLKTVEWQEDDDEIQVESITLPNGKPGRIAALFFQIEMEEPDEEDREELTAEESAFMASYIENAPENRALIMVAAGTNEIDHTSKMLGIALIASAILTVLAMYFATKMIVKQSCEPIEKLATLTSEIDPADAKDNRLPESEAPEELRPLVEQFNTLLKRVESTIERERRFSIDIAHELRTPVAELRSLMEVELFENSRSEDEKEIFRESSQIGQRMSRMIEVLSTLHEADSGNGVLEKRNCNPISIFEARLRLFSGETNRSIKFNIDAKSTSLKTDPYLLAAIFDNLMRNAIHHSSGPGKIAVAIHTANRFELEVSNPADKLEPSDLEFLTRPFWRKDESRSVAGHFGLGLSLVNSYVDLIGGTLELGISEDHRFVAKVFIFGNRNNTNE